MFRSLYGDLIFEWRVIIFSLHIYGDHPSPLRSIYDSEYTRVRINLTYLPSAAQRLCQHYEHYRVPRKFGEFHIAFHNHYQPLFIRETNVSPRVPFLATELMDLAYTALPVGNHITT